MGLLALPEHELKSVKYKFWLPVVHKETRAAVGKQATTKALSSPALLTLALKLRQETTAISSPPIQITGIASQLQADVTLHRCS